MPHPLGIPFRPAAGHDPYTQPRCPAPARHGLSMEDDR